MQALDFDALKRELAAAGAAPSVIARITEELKEHCDDAEAAALARGMSPASAHRQALASLGSAETIAAAVAAQQQLLNWRHRWPQSARCIDSVAYCLALPAAPFVYSATHPAAVVRWSLSSSLAICITASILFAMQWMIAQGLGV